MDSSNRTRGFFTSGSEHVPPVKTAFNVGDADDMIALLVKRGDRPEDLADRYKMSMDDISAALERVEARSSSPNM